MTICVSGGWGFIGSNFIRYWQKHHPSDKIINIDKLTYAGNASNLADLGNSITNAICDIADYQAIQDIFIAHSPDIIVHFAAETHVDRSIINASDFIRTNVVGTENLLRLCLKYGIKRIHLISTDEVFGSLDLEDGKKFSETTPYDPKNPYAASKAAADHLGRAYFYTHKLPVTISNCTNNFGPYQFPEKFIPTVITSFLRNKRVPIYGDGKYVRDWLYVEDHCRAIDRILKAGKPGETYCIGGGFTEISNLDVARQIGRILNGNLELIKYVADRPGHDRRYAMDFAKITRELRWSPQFTFAKALQKTVEWYKDNQKWWKPLIN